MEPPPPPAAAAAAATSQYFNYAGSVDSSPRSRNTDSWDDQLLPPAAGAGKLRLMCSYGGHIIPRPHDKSLCYAGGETRIIVVDRHTITLFELANRLSKTLLNGQPFTLKYQLPSEDLDSLISVTTDEDLENMIDEFDRLTAAAGAKSSRIRVFLFPTKLDSASSIGSLLENSSKSEDWFLNALNGTNSTGFSNPSSMNFLLGLDENGNGGSEAKGSVGNNGNKHNFQDVQSVPDSPMMDTRSSFESTSSSPSLAHLPPIRVHVEDQRAAAAVGELDEQLSRLSLGAAALQKQNDGDFRVSSSPATAVSGEYPNWVFPEDERFAYTKPPQPQIQTQTQKQPPQSQLQQLKAAGVSDLSSPNSVSSDNSSTTNQRGMIYLDPNAQNPSGNNRVPINPLDPKPSSDPNSRIQFQQIQDSNYALPNQFEQQYSQSNQNQQQYPQSNPQQQQQQQQFIQGGGHYMHHQPTTGTMPMPSYYPLYQQQQQQPQPQPHHGLDQQYQVYYMPTRQNQAYTMPVQQQQQQSNYTDSNAKANANAPSSRSQPPLANPIRNPPQVPSNQTQNQNQPMYFGFSQIQHPIQSTVAANYGYEVGDPTRAQMYYAQALPQQVTAQYQALASATATGSPKASDSNIKQQQIRNSQP